MDLFDSAEIDIAKERINEIFKQALHVSETDHPAYWFWYRGLSVVHAENRSHACYIASRDYLDELKDWLDLNIPTPHFRGCGGYKREDFILSVH